MDELRLLLQSLAAAASAVSSGISLGGFVLAYLRRKAREDRAQQLHRWLEDLGCLSEAAVRSLVEDWAAGQPSLSEAQREELIGLLINLTRGARFLSSHGTPKSSYLRCERWLTQLLDNLQPVRRRGEIVGPGHNWRLERFLGMGGFGEVWVARSQEGFPLPRAFKFFTQPNARDWIEKEGKGLAAVLKRLGRHPHLIEFIDLGIKDQPWPFLALEYVGGGSLEDWIVEDAARRPRINKHELIGGVIRGLARAHENNIYHGDLKPANLLLTEGPDVQAKIADFGLARVAAAEFTPVSTQASQPIQVGTSMYLPPEAHEVAGNHDAARFDVFALGVVWYQLLMERLERPPYDFADQLADNRIDRHTIRLVSRCLAHPGRRFKDACRLADEFDDVAPQDWAVPPGMFDVQDLVRDYIGSASSG